jgi:hypothetical protein
MSRNKCSSRSMSNLFETQTQETGARKHNEREGVWLHTSYTPGVTYLITGTGVSKVRWPAGNNPVTHYGVGVMMSSTVESMHKDFHVSKTIVAGCDQPGQYVDAETQTDEKTVLSLQTRLAHLWSAVLPLLPKKIQMETAAGRNKTRLAFTSLKTSSEPTFIRDSALEDDSDTPSAVTSVQGSPLLLPSSPKPLPAEEQLPGDPPPRI